VSENKKSLGFQIAGWVLFMACALCYIVANIRSGDWLSLAGSAIFLLACLVFMVPLVIKK
jgi:hypothetical protein